MTTYRRIGAVKTAIDIIGMLADQREPISGKDLADALNLPHGTVMSHLATFEDANWVRRVGEYFETGQALAAIWARKKAALSSKIANLTNELDELEGK